MTQQLIYSGYHDEVGEMYGWHGEEIISDDTLVVPFIGVDIGVGHPINKTSDDVYIDKCYFVINNYREIRKNITYRHSKDPETIIKDSYRSFSHLHQFMFGGKSILSNTNIEHIPFFTEWRVWAQYFAIYLLPDSKISDQIFYPFDTQNYKANMNFDDVVSFARNEQIPESLKEKVFVMA